MEVILEYAGRSDEGRVPCVPACAMPILLTFAHVNLCWQISRLMLIPVCRQLGTHFTIWTPIAWLPGCAVTLCAGSAVGAVIMFLMSVLAGCTLQCILERYRWGLPNGVAAMMRDWYVWLAAVLWFGWIPVPAFIAFLYQFTTWATTGR